MLAFLEEKGVQVEVPTDKKQAVDFRAYQEALEDAVKEADPEGEAFTRWAVEKLKPALGQLVIERATDSGAIERVPYTLDNILHSMTRTVRQGETTVGFGATRAAGAKQFGSLDEVKGARDRIVNSEDFKKQSSRLEALFDEIVYKVRFVEPEAFGIEESILEAIVAHLQQGVPMGRALSAAGLGDDLSPAVVAQVEGFAKKLVAMPTEYFEAKPQRVVKLEEFSAAVVPDNASPKVLEALQRRGITRVQTYPAGDESARRAAIANVAVDAGILFQAEAGQPGAPALGDVVFASATENEKQKRLAFITLGAGQNLSTFLHENAHVFLEMFRDLALREGAPKEVLADWRRLETWMGLAEGAKPEKRHHEIFAEGGVHFFNEGKAPSLELEEVFRRFSRWLRTVVQFLFDSGVPINDEIRGVFGRLFATDEEILRARGGIGFRPLFRTAEEARMTPEEFAALRASYDAVSERAAQAVQARVFEAETEAASEARQEEEAKASEEVGREYDARPDVRAARYLRDGVLQLAGDDGTLQEVPTEGTVGLERKAVLRMLGVRQVPTALRPLVRTKQDAKTRAVLHPDEAAQLFGYETGVALLAALKDVPQREEFVQEEVARRMAEAHPTVLTDRTQLRETVQDALHEEGTTEPLLREWAALKKLLPEGAPTALPLEAVRRAASLMAQRTRVRRADAQNARLAEKRAGQEAAAAWAQGDIARANEAKLRQVLNHLLYRELAKARTEVSAFNKLLNSATTQKTRKMLGLAGPHFRDAVDALTESLAARPLTTDADTRSEALDALLTAMEEEKLGTAFDVNTVRSLLLEPRAWQDMTLLQMREASQMLHQVQHLAETASRVHLEETVASTDSLARTALDEVQGLPTVAPMPTDKALRGTWQAIRFKLGVSLQALRDPEEQLRHLGPTAHKFFMGGLLKSRALRRELAESVGAFFATTWQELPEALQARRYELVDASALPLPPQLQREGPVTRQWVWMVALNLGNETTRAHILQGYGWTEQQALDFIGKTLEKEELDFLQGVWDMMDKELQPRLAAHYESVNGVRPDAPKATPIQTPHGTYRGGFFPVQDDPHPIAKAYAEGLSRGETSIAGSVAASYRKPSSKRSVRVLNLAWDVVPAYVGQTIHYLSTNTYLREARRLLEHPTMVEAVVKRRGVTGLEVLKSFLTVVETDSPDTQLPTLQRDIMSVFGWTKTFLPVMALAANVGNACGDFFNPVVAVVKGAVKFRYTSLVYGKALAGVLIPALPGLRVGREKLWGDMRARVLEKSWFMREMKESATEKLKKDLAEVGARGNVGWAHRYGRAAWENAFFLQALTGALTSTIVWEARYQQGLAEGLADADAVQAADDAIRATFPTGDIAQQPIFLRDKVANGGQLLMFGFMSKLGNMKWDLLERPLERLAMAEGWQETLGTLTPLALRATQVMLLTLVAQVLPDIFAGRGKDDDEEVEEWLLRRLAAGQPGQVPLFSFPLEWATEKGVDKLLGKERPMRPPSARAAPAAAAVERLAKAAIRAADTDAEALDRLLAVLAATNTQAGKTGGYVVDVLQDEAQTGGWDVAQGLLYGPTRETERESPVTLLRKGFTGK